MESRPGETLRYYLERVLGNLHLPMNLMVDFELERRYEAFRLAVIQLGEKGTHKSGGVFVLSSTSEILKWYGHCGAQAGILVRVARRRS